MTSKNRVKAEQAMAVLLVSIGGLCAFADDGTSPSPSPTALPFAESTPSAQIPSQALGQIRSARIVNLAENDGGEMKYGDSSVRQISWDKTWRKKKKRKHPSPSPTASPAPDSQGTGSSGGPSQ